VGDPQAVDVGYILDDSAGLTDQVSVQSTGGTAYTRTVTDAAGITDSVVITKASTATPATVRGTTAIPGPAVSGNAATAAPATVAARATVPAVTVVAARVTVVAWPHRLTVTRPPGTVRRTGGVAGVRRTL
jgi:hypothetical protein